MRVIDLKTKFFLTASVLCAFICITPFSAEAARILFTGDVMTHVDQIVRARRGDTYDFYPQFLKVSPLFKSTFTVASLESVFAGCEAGFSGYPLFNSPDELADAIARAGIDTVTLANNHILDMGYDGATRTVQTLDQRNIRHVGISIGAEDPSGPMIAEIDGVRFAISSFTYGTNVPADRSDDLRVSVIHEDDIIAAIERSRAMSADIIAVCLHWGGEYADRPGTSERDIASLCIAQGADLVIGTHPHRPQRIETRIRDDGRTAVIAWSLGSLISSQRGHALEHGAILAIDTARKGHERAHIDRVSVMPIAINQAPPGFGAARIAVPLDISKPTASNAAASLLDILGAGRTKDKDGLYTLWDE